ncbi:MAG TPA: YbaK/EbsC family protein [Ktedonobacteraceae bacterium]|jgi:Ala-tRNA(Pro) deacylase|nr:YbaK/EbsC family protein [Ktedonobacteraceae bacterium]
MPCKERLEAYLQEHQVPFQEQQHARAFSAQRIAESEHVSSRKVAKAVIAVVDGKMISLVLPASSHVDLELVRTLLGARSIRLAHEAEFAAAFPDCEVGTMPPFGNLYNIPVYVEKSLASEETIIFPAGTYTDTISLNYVDFERLAHPQMMEFARPLPIA